MFLNNKNKLPISSNNSKNNQVQNNTRNLEYVDRNTTVGEVINDKAFENFGNLLFPVDLNIDQNTTLEDVGSYYMWYNNINPDKTVEIINHLKEQSESENQIFYDIYTEEEIREDPEKENTGLFFFKGNPGGKVAIANAGGGFY